MATGFPPAVQSEAALLPVAPPARGRGRRRSATSPTCPGSRSTTPTAATSTSSPSPSRSAATGVPSLLGRGGGCRVAYRAGKLIDAHAGRNTTSVHTAGKTFHMPPRLDELTSLVAGEERLTVVAAMTVDGDGGIDGADFTGGVRSAPARLPRRAAWLDGRAEPPPALAAVPGLEEQVRLQDEVARRLRRRRHERGALDLEDSTARPVFAGGTIVGLAVERTPAQKLIEDVMIAANSATAAFLDARGLPALRRVVRAPARWDRLVELAAAAGDRLPAAPDARALADFLARRRAADRDGYVEVCLAVRKLLGGGEYAVDLPGKDAPGHFGLAVPAYTHSTAPNRRLPDLVTQRSCRRRSPAAAAPTRTRSCSTSPAAAPSARTRGGGSSGRWRRPPPRSTSPRASARRSTRW